jgi:hypothetical protein
MHACMVYVSIYISIYIYRLNILLRLLFPMDYQCFFSCRCSPTNEFKVRGRLGDDNVCSKILSHSFKKHNKSVYVMCCKSDVARADDVSRSYYYFISDNDVLHHLREPRRTHTCCFRMVDISKAGAERDISSTTSLRIEKDEGPIDNGANAPDVVVTKTHGQFDVWHLEHRMPMNVIVKFSQYFRDVLCSVSPNPAWDQVALRNVYHYRQEEAKRLGEVKWIHLAKFRTEKDVIKDIYAYDVLDHFQTLAATDPAFNALVKSFKKWRVEGLKPGGEFSRGVLTCNMCGSAYQEHEDFSDPDFFPLILYEDGVTTTKSMEVNGLTKEISAYYLVWDRETPGSPSKWSAWNIVPAVLVSQKLHTEAIQRHIVDFFVKIFKDVKIPLQDKETFIKPRVVLSMGDWPSLAKVNCVKGHGGKRLCFHCAYDFPAQHKNFYGERVQHLSYDHRVFANKARHKEEFLQEARKVQDILDDFAQRGEVPRKEMEALEKKQQETGNLGWSPLFDLPSFNPLTCVVPDWMHTHDEGVAKYHVNEFTKFLCDKAGYATFQDLQMFTSRWQNKRKRGDDDRPRIGELWRKSDKGQNKGNLCLKAAQVRDFVFILLAFAEEVLEERTQKELNCGTLPDHIETLRLLAETYSLVFTTNVWNDVMLHVLQELLDKHRTSFYMLYRKSWPKSHATMHYVDAIRAVGSLKHYMCYAFESFHQELISAWDRSNKKSIDKNGILHEFVNFHRHAWNEFKKSPEGQRLIAADA